jgi:hypothetical protein
LSEIILEPSLSDTIIVDGIASIAFHTWMQQVTEAVKPPLSGSGSPEGVIIATIGRWYVDTGASAGTGIYFKESGEGDTGWVARS